MNKKILVFGATGGLGSHICVYLKSKGYDIVAAGHRNSDNGFFADYNIPYYSVDIADKNEFRKLPKERYAAVLHFAGVLPAVMKGYNSDIYISSIICGTKNVLDFCIECKVEKIVFPQSLFDVKYLFGSKVPIPADSKRIAPLDGDHAMYVICKNTAVDIIEHYYKVKGLKRFVLRLPRIYMYNPNPYTFTDGEKVMISDRYLIQKAIEGNDLELWGDPYRILETCAVGDFLQIVEKCVVSSLDGGIYNVGSGGTLLKDRIEGIMEVFNTNPNAKIIYRPDKPNGTQYVLDISKTVCELGYEPKYKWKDYLLEFKKEMRENSFNKLWGVPKDY
jgi:nucleoside-diphosphate-sugar epimerase